MRSPHADHPRVFISYSHDSHEHLDRVLVLSDRLRADGIDCHIDQYEESPAEGWPRWMVNQIEDAEFVLVVCTENYERRFRGKEEPGKGLGVKWEGAIVTQEIYEAEAKNTVFIPVLFSPHSSASISVVLRGVACYELYTSAGYDLLYRRLTHQPLILKPDLGSRRSMPPRERTPAISLEVAALTSPPTAEQPRFQVAQAASKDGSERERGDLPVQVRTRVEQPTPSAQTGLPYQGKQVLSKEQQASPAQPQREFHRPRVAFWRRGVWVAMVLVLLLLAGVGGWYWDAYHREHVEYYANVIKRWGLPEGVGRLTDEQFRSRNSTLMFIKRGRQGAVHEIRQVNSRGVYHPTGTNTNSLYGFLNPLEQKRNDFNTDERDTGRVTFERNSNNRIIRQIGYNRGDRRLYSLHYVEPNFAIYMDGAYPVAVREFGITHIQFVRPAAGEEAGLDKELRFFDQGRKPQPDHEGVYGYQYVFDQNGLIVETVPLGADGQPAVTRNGTAKSVFTRNALGNIIRTASFGRDGQPVPHDIGPVGVNIVYDHSGNATKTSFFGIEDQPVTLKRLGAAGAEFGYDQQGNVTEVKYFDTNWQPVLVGICGCARLTFVWDARGSALITRFGPDGKQIMSDRSVKVRGVWDERGYRVGISFFNEHDRPTRNKLGCASGRETRDKHGNLAEETCLDEADHLLRNMWGYAKLKRVHDERGNATEEAYFGPRGQPERYEERYVKVWAKYSPQGNPIENMYLDAIDHPVKTRDGYAKVTNTYDMHGRVVEAAFFDESGQPTSRKGGYAIIRKTYDTRGRLTEGTLFDPEGKPARHDDGYVKLKYAYDLRGYQIERAYYDEHDQLTLHTDGYAKQQSKYNDRGQLLEVAFVDPDGAFVLHKKRGYAKGRWTYNERGQVESLARFDSQDQLMQTINGYAVSRYVYDDYGREIQRVFLDLNGSPVHTRVAIQDMEPDRNSQRFGLQVGDLIFGYDGEEARL